MLNIWSNIERSLEKAKHTLGDRNIPAKNVDSVIRNKIYESLPNQPLRFDEAINHVLAKTSLKDGHEIGRNILRLVNEKRMRVFNYRDDLIIRKNKLDV